MVAARAIQLRDRTVWQLMASYGVGSWIVLQVAETLSSLIGLPLWFGQALLVALLLGFGVLLATSLVQQSAARGVGVGLSEVLTWRNVLAGAGAAGVVILLGTGAYLGARSMGLGPIGTLQARGVFEDQERLILADFEESAVEAGLGETVTALLRIDLSQSPVLSVLEPIQLGPVLTRMRLDAGAAVTYEVALEAAKREGVKAVVTGELLQIGSAVVVSARIVAASSGEVLVAVRETAKATTDLPDVVDRVSAQLRERVGESLRTIQGDPPLDQVTTSSIQALDKYAQANRANDAGDTQRAVVLLDEAIAEDSIFAMAYRKLGILLANMDREPERRIAAFTRAHELRDRLTDRERWLAEAAYLLYVERDEPGSIDRYVTLLESYPTDRTALNNLGIAYQSLGRSEDAAELYLRSVRQGGAPATTYSSATLLLYALGDTAGTREVLEEFERTHPENARLAGLRMSLLSARFDYAGAEEVARALLARQRGTGGEITARVVLAQIRLVQGRAEEGRREFRAALELVRDLGGNGGIDPIAAEALIEASVALGYLERPDVAVRVMDAVYSDSEAAALTSDERQDLQFAGVYSLAGRPERARRLLDAYEAEVGPDQVEVLGRWHQAQGLLALAEGRTADAIDLLHRGRDENRECALCGLAELGRVFDAASQPDSARHYLERYVNEPDADRLQNADFLSFWYVVPRLGELHAAAGDTFRARQRFTLFLDVTQGADADFSEKRDRIRAALQALDEH